MLKDYIREAFGPSFFVFVGLAIASGSAVYVVNGPAVFATSIDMGLDLLAAILPRLAAALLVAGFIRVLVPQEFVASWLGGNSSLKGLVVADLAGIITPGGPMTAFSMIAALRTAGADRGVLIAYAFGWSMMGFQRMLLWELPLLGADFTLLRLSTSVVMPILTGFAVRLIPWELPVDRAGRG